MANADGRRRLAVLLVVAGLSLAAALLIPGIGLTAREWGRREKAAANLRQVQRALGDDRQRQRSAAVAGSVSPAVKDEAGVLVHTVRSEYQSAATKIKVLLPSARDGPARHPVLYVLPVEPMDGVQWGDGLREVSDNDLHNKFGVICVQPTFSDLPWYADHPTIATRRQETYFLNVVVPFIDRTYPTLARPEGRWLLGFSKSGYGAFSLLLRNPELFGRAVAWDAPLMMDRPDRYGMADIFGTQENFEKYRISTLLKQRATALSTPLRLVHFGYGNFREHHQSAHKLMAELKIADQYRDGPKREHSWHGGWLPEAVEMLAAKPKTP